MQSRFDSLREAATNVAIGWMINFAGNMVVLPWFGLAPTVGDAVGIGLVFTGIALARNYAVRRIFNRK